MDQNRLNYPGIELLIGMPGAGKTTYAETLAKQNPNVTIIYMDAIRDDSARAALMLNTDPVRLRGLMEDYIFSNAMENKRFAVYDACTPNKEKRRDALEYIRSRWPDVPIYCTYLKTSKEFALEMIEHDKQSGKKVRETNENALNHFEHVSGGHIEEDIAEEEYTEYQVIERGS